MHVCFYTTFKKDNSIFSIENFMESARKTGNHSMPDRNSAPKMDETLQSMFIILLYVYLSLDQKNSSSQPSSL